MENAQLISLSRQIALQRQMDVVANNLANINTTGFKGETVLFEDYLMPGAADDTFANGDQDLHFTQDWGTMHNMANGNIEHTGNQLDVALDGEGFLVVQTANGEAYTRNGALQISPAGQLVDLDGNPVLSDLGPIQFTKADTTFNFGENGAVFTNEGSKGKLRIVEFDNVGELQKAGANLFVGGDPLPAVGTRLVAGAIERSNVQGVTEISSMIRIQRAYQQLATIMQQQDEVRRSAINRLGDLNA
jgi:flagellar basal-body rod protein FlgF